MEKEQYNNIYTEEELYKIYLEKGIWRSISFNEYIAKIRIKGISIVSNDEKEETRGKKNESKSSTLIEEKE